MKQTEARIQHDIRLAAEQISGLTLWRNNVGALEDVNGRLVRYGLVPGSSDLIGIYRGRFVAVEIKRPGGRTNPKRAKLQRLFRELVRASGGYAIVVSSVDEFLRLMKEA